VITHILDTSAILAHYLKENGADTVDAILRSSPEVGVSLLSLIELKTCLGSLRADQKEIDRAFRLYADSILSNIPVNREIANLAVQIRETTRPRVPLVDSVIAATAKAHDAVLVHRDPHLAAIPLSSLKQIVLPQK
jgi:predicted nucleic acid-binding protein